MRDSKSPALWRVSAFRREQVAGERPLDNDRPALLPTTLLADLRQLQRNAQESDVLETIAACLRHREAALLYLEYGSHVWPLTLFSRHSVYHSPIDVNGLASDGALARLKVISAEPPVVHAPDHPVQQRDGKQRYQPLSALLWTIALHGPRATLLNEISGPAAYRLVAGGVADLPGSLGALGPAVLRLRQEAASVDDVGSWPGMSHARASRLLNALYLNGGLMISRSHPAALKRKTKTTGWRGLLGMKR